MDARRLPGELPDDLPADQAGYDALKRAKIERGLAQSRDRSIMISVEQMQRNLLMPMYLGD